MGERGQLVFDTPFVDLVREFNVGGRINSVTLPYDLYKEYVRLYRRSVDMHKKLLSVMGDGEHQLILEEGRDKFTLPANDIFAEDLNDLNRIIKSFDPFGVTFSHGKVKLSDTQLQGFFDLFSKDYDVVHNLFEMFRATDYLKYHRHLRNEGIKYAGPTSLQEIMNVLVGVAHAHHRQNAYIKELSDVRPG